MVGSLVTKQLNPLKIIIKEISVITKQSITKKLNVPTELIWESIRNIGKLDAWFPFIETCRVEGVGQGALRFMSIVGNGGKIKDVIEEIDDANRRLVYLRPISPFPVSYYKGTVEVFPSYDGLGVIVWTIDFDSKPEDVASVCELVRSAIGEGIDGLEIDLLTNQTC